MNVEFIVGRDYGQSRSNYTNDARIRGLTSSPLILKEYDGHIPIALVYMQMLDFHDFFPPQKPWTTDSIKYAVERDGMRNLDHLITFQKSPRNYSDRNVASIIISGFTLVGFDGKSQPLFSIPAINDNRENVQYIHKKEVDVFALGLMRVDAVSSVTVSGKYMYVDSEAIRVLISKEKFKSPAYMSDNYNPTVRNHLRRNLYDKLEGFGITPEFVNDSVIRQYYDLPFYLNTRSISEVMELDREMKSHAFLNATNILNNVTNNK